MKVFAWQKRWITKYDIYYQNTVTISKFLRLVDENAAVWSFNI
jgi:hypothetical protein